MWICLRQSIFVCHKFGMWRHPRVISRDNCSQNGRTMAELRVLRDNLRDTEVDYMYIVRKLCIQKFHFFNEVSIFIFNVQNGGNKRKTSNMIMNIESIWLYCKKFWMYRSPYTCIPACSVHGSLTQQIQKPCTSINS